MGKVKFALAAALVLAVAGPAGGQGFLQKLEDATGGLGKKFGVDGNSAGSLSEAEIGKGLREALRVGTERLTAQLGTTNGFNGDPQCIYRCRILSAGFSRR